VKTNQPGDIGVMSVNMSWILHEGIIGGVMASWKPGGVAIMKAAGVWPYQCRGQWRGVVMSAKMVAALANEKRSG
jgi:hypothetical protein